MKYENLKIFLEGFRLMGELGFSIKTIFIRLRKFNESFDVDKLREELMHLIEDKSFRLVDFAIETKFIDTSLDNPSTKLDTDNLIIYTDAAEWRHNFPDGRPSIEDREKLKDQFRNLNVHRFSDINEIMDSGEFSWLPFEMRRSFKLEFGNRNYTNDDIIYEIKKNVWEYLFPSDENTERLTNITLRSNLIIKQCKLNDGWMDMDDLVANLSLSFSEVDLYYLTKVKWDKNIQSLSHFRNPFAMGFKRYHAD